jgi:DNA-binding MarR family transcriptional regulator
MAENKLDTLLKEGGYEIEDLQPENSEKRIELIDAKQVQEMEIAEINWIVNGLLPEGAAVLAGRPKIGKSWMALDISVAVARGFKTMSFFETNTSAVLYVPYEDNLRRLQSRLKMILSGSITEVAPPNLYYPKDNFDFPKLNETGVDEIQKILDEVPDIKLVVIDTLGRGIADKGRKDRSIFNADYELTARLQKMAISRNICVLIIHHTRKEKTENVFDQIAGSTGITAGVDTMLVLREKNKEHLLHVTGRDVIECEYRLEFDVTGCVWRVVDKVSELKITAEREEIYELIKNYGRQMRTGEIAEALGKTKSNVSKMLGKMVKNDILVSVKFGEYDLSEEEKGKVNLAEQLREHDSVLDNGSKPQLNLFKIS